MFAINHQHSTYGLLCCMLENHFLLLKHDQIYTTKRNHQLNNERYPKQLLYELLCCSDGVEPKEPALTGIQAVAMRVGNDIGNIEGNQLLGQLQQANRIITTDLKAD